MNRIALLVGWVVALCTFPVIAQQPPGPAVGLEDATPSEQRLRVHFIDIGPGLAMLIETPGDRKHIFIDGGKWGLAGLSGYTAHFVGDDNDIDIAIVTHADLDHFLGMKRIFNEYEVKAFWNTGYTSPELSQFTNWSQFLTQVETEEDCDVYSPIEEWVSVGDRETIDDSDTPDDTSDDVVVQYLNVDSQPPARDAVFGREFSGNRSHPGEQ